MGYVRVFGLCMIFLLVLLILFSTSKSDPFEVIVIKKYEDNSYEKYNNSQLLVSTSSENNISYYEILKALILVLVSFSIINYISNYVK